MKKGKYIRGAGGMAYRVMHTIELFHAKHGIWPTSITMLAGDLEALGKYHLTPKGLQLLRRCVEIRTTDDYESPLIASADDGRTCAYMEPGVEVSPDRTRATEWLGYGDETV